MDIEEPLNPTEVSNEKKQNLGSNANTDMPELSSWHYVCPCHCIPCSKFDHEKYIYCGYWKFSTHMPIVCSLSMLFCYSIFIFTVFPFLQNLIVKIISMVEVSIMVIMFFWSYFAATCKDPGYLPFNWAQTKKSKYSWQEIMSGTAITEEQINYVQGKLRPPGCSFSKSVGRYIIRADHFCLWIGNWVGRRNHKQFALFPLYGIFADISFAVWYFVMPNTNQDKSSVIFALQIISLMIEAFYLLILGSSFYFLMSDILNSQTKIQQYKKEEKVSKPKIEALKEVFGYGSKCCWICPTNAFSDELDLLHIENTHDNHGFIDDVEETNKKTESK